MKFEEFENAWAAQPASPHPVNLAALQSATWPEMRRRHRFLCYALGVTFFASIVYPLLSVANFFYYRPANALLFWSSVAIHVGVIVAILLVTWQRLRRHRALLRENASSVRAFATTALEATESEIRENTLGLRLAPLTYALAWLSTYANNPDGYTWQVFLTGTVVTTVIVGLVAMPLWRHSRLYLEPRRDSLVSLLRDLD